jgi:hypothetical protein
VLGLRGDLYHPYEVAQALALAPGARLLPRVPALAPAAVAAQWVQVVRDAG